MLIHNAHFWLKKDLSAADRAVFEEEVKRLAAIPYLERGLVGKPAPAEERPVTDHSFITPRHCTSRRWPTMNFTRRSVRTFESLPRTRAQIRFDDIQPTGRQIAEGDVPVLRE